VADFEVLYGHLLGRLRESTEILIPSPYLNPNILSSKQGSRPPALDVQDSGGHVICHMCIVLDRVAANLFTF
jgi:hypothetical protein